MTRSINPYIKPGYAAFVRTNDVSEPESPIEYCFNADRVARAFLENGGIPHRIIHGEDDLSRSIAEMLAESFTEPGLHFFKDQILTKLYEKSPNSFRRPYMQDRTRMTTDFDKLKLDSPENLVTAVFEFDTPTIVTTSFDDDFWDEEFINEGIENVFPHRKGQHPTTIIRSIENFCGGRSWPQILHVRYHPNR